MDPRPTTARVVYDRQARGAGAFRKFAALVGDASAMLILYHAPKSSASRRVRLFLEEKGLQYEKRAVDLSRQEQHSEAYLAINPLGVVPTLLHDGRPLHESGTICEYLDDCFPEPSLRPTDPYDLALMRNWVRYLDGMIDHLIRFNWRHALAKRAGALSDEELAVALARIPDPARREAWRRTARDPFRQDELDASRNALHGLLDRMESALKDGALVGGRYGLADIAAAPFVRRIEEEISPDAVAMRPNCDAWWIALQNRPAYARAGFDPFFD